MRRSPEVGIRARCGQVMNGKVYTWSDKIECVIGGDRCSEGIGVTIVQCTMRNGRYLNGADRGME